MIRFGPRAKRVVRLFVWWVLLLYCAQLLVILICNYAWYWQELSYHLMYLQILTSDAVSQILGIAPVSYALLRNQPWGKLYAVVFQVIWVLSVGCSRWAPYPLRVVSYLPVGIMPSVIYIFWPLLLVGVSFLLILRQSANVPPSKLVDPILPSAT